MTDPAGSKVPSEAHRQATLRAEGPAPDVIVQAFPAIWERGFARGISTKVWNADGSVQPLTRIPGYGTFHRLVVDARSLTWPEEIVIRHGDIVIRTVTGTLEGERTSPMDEIQEHDGGITLTGQPSGSAEETGRFLEVVAPGEDSHDAEQFAFALLGYLSMFIGDHVVGAVVFSEPYRATPEGQFGELRIPSTARFPRTARMNDFAAAADNRLSKLTDDDDMSRARIVALRWYEKAIRVDSPLDALLSYYLGVEAIINTYAALNDQVPEVADRLASWTEIEKLIGSQLTSETKGLLKQRLVQSTATERFRFYAAQKGLDQFDAFRLISGIRNRALHGRPTPVTEEQRITAKELLMKVLSQELEVTDPPPPVPEIFGLVMDYLVVFPEAD